MRLPLKPLCASILLALTALAQASSNGLVISQVYGAAGGGTPLYKHDFVELFNASASTVSLSNLSLQYGSATGTGTFGSNGVVVLPNIALQPGQYFLISLGSGSGAGAALPVAADLSHTSGNIANISGTGGKLVLVNGTTGLACNGSSTLCNAAQSAQIIDLVGYGGANFAEGQNAPAPTATTTIVRAQVGCQDTNNNAADFAASGPTPAPLPRHTGTALAPCSGGSPSPSPTPSPTPSPSAVPIAQIQGSGPTSPLLGQTVTTTGVVTKLNNNGFFMQSLVPDNNPDTSDGIFVFTSTAPTAHVGEHVQLTGLVDEFNVGSATNAQTLANPVTELKSVTGLSVLSSGHQVTPTVIAFPEATDGDLEKVEGMLVKIDTPLTASQNYFLGRYGQVTLSAGGRLQKPTNLFPAGSVDAQNLTLDNARRRLILDDGSSLQNPNPTPYFAADQTQRAGDTLASLTGVVDYGLATSSADGLADHKIHPTEPVTFTRDNPRTANPAAVGGNTKVASFNVLNYFNGNGAGGGFPTARGADTLAEFNRQRAKIIAALQAIDADAVGLMEIENDAPGAQSAIADLVNGLNTAYGSQAYAAVPAPSQSGATGTDEIKVAMIYKPAKLSLSGPAVSDTSAIHNRPPLAQTFQAPNGEKFTVVVNHFKSKGCDASAPAADQDQGDGQGCFNDRRQQQATALLAFIQGIQATQTDTDVLVIGDLNAYAKEAPVLTLASQGLVDLVEAYNGPNGYSYVFDGEIGYLDHALASASLSAQVTGALQWHINADEPSVIDYNTEFKQPACATCGPDYYSATPYRSSDHDPVVVGLSLVKAIQGSARGDQLTGTAGDDRITGGEGADLITTGAGRDVIAYNSLRDALDTVTDFTPGQDRIDLRGLLQSLAINPANALSGGHITLVDTAAGVQVRVDSDGLAGPTLARPLVTLRGVTAAQLDASRDLLL